MAMIPNLLAGFGVHVGRATHADVVGAAVRALEEQNWTVEQDPRRGAMRPDIIAHDPEGSKTYVFELKTQRDQPYLGAVAQVEGYRDRLIQEGHADTRGVLVLGAEAPHDIDAVAEAAGVDVLRTDPSNPRGIVSSVASFLDADGSGSSVDEADAQPL